MQAGLRSLIGKKVLVEGDAGSGKTAYAQRLVLEALDLPGPGDVVIIDMAPRRRRVGGRFVGGRLRMPKGSAARIEYLSPDRVFAPRLEGRNGKEVRELGEANAAELEKVLRRVRDRAMGILFINDLTMFLHAGDAGILIDAILGAGTFIGTGYKGEFLANDKGSGVTSRERALLEKIEKFMDVVITL